ncbi:MAG TPA: PAS domain S-box protein, partial [Pararhizobium sp.]|nr:PAS domain S-box protein [Pararhizobium sp.]
MSSFPIGQEAAPATGMVLDIGGRLEVPREFLELIPVAVYICDRDGLILQYNRRAAELWGRSPKLSDTTERFCGSYRLYRLDGGPISHAECPMADALRTGVPVRDQEAVVERPDGTRVVALVNIDVIRNEAGAVIGAINCFQDVTERRQAQTALRRRERQWHEMLQALPVAVYMTDAEGRITFYNEAAATLWGQRPEIGKN